MLDEFSLDLNSLKVGDFLSYCEEDIFLIVKIDKQDKYVVFDFLCPVTNQIFRDHKIWRGSDFALKAFRIWPHND